MASAPSTSSPVGGAPCKTFLTPKVHCRPPRRITARTSQGRCHRERRQVPPTVLGGPSIQKHDFGLGLTAAERPATRVIRPDPCPFDCKAHDEAMEDQLERAPTTMQPPTPDRRTILLEPSRLDGRDTLPPAHPQKARAVGDAERGFVLEPRRGFEQSRHLLLAQQDRALRGSLTSLRGRTRSGRSSVTVKKNRSAAMAALIDPD